MKFLKQSLKNNKEKKKGGRGGESRLMMERQIAGGGRAAVGRAEGKRGSWSLTVAQERQVP